MSDRIKFSVSAVPIETLTDDNSGTHDILASEIGTTLGGSGDSLTLAGYSLSAVEQGYKDAAVNYVDAVHTANGAMLSPKNDPDFIFIKNTGYRYSSATVLGAASTDCILVAIQIDAGHENTDGWVTYAGTPQTHYIELAFLQPGQAILLPLGGSNKSISQYGSNAGDFTPLCSLLAESDIRIHVKTVQSNGSASTDGNAVEFLLVT